MKKIINKIALIGLVASGIVFYSLNNIEKIHIPILAGVVFFIVFILSIDRKKKMASKIKDWEKHSQKKGYKKN